MADPAGRHRSARAPRADGSRGPATAARPSRYQYPDHTDPRAGTSPGSCGRHPLTLAFVITYKEQAMLWTLDSTHSTIDFSVKHLGIATGRGRFRTFSASAETAADGKLATVEATIAANSIDTGV